MGLVEGYGDFLRVIHGADTLKARLWRVQQEALEHLEQTLREETAAAPDDPLPTLMAGQISWVQSTLMALIGRETVAGRKPAEVSREALALLDDMEDLLSEKVLNYAVRAPE